MSSTTTASLPHPAVVLQLLPLLVCATVPSSHSAALSLILHPSLPALHGVYLISLPVHLIERSVRQTLPVRRGGVRPLRPALLLSPARKEERRGKGWPTSLSSSLTSLELYMRQHFYSQFKRAFIIDCIKQLYKPY